MDVWLIVFAAVGAVIGGALVALIMAADGLRAARRESYGRFLAAAGEHTAAMDRMAAARVARGPEPDPGSADELRRLVGLIELLGPDNVWAAARAFFDNVLWLDRLFAERPSYPIGFDDAWAQQQRDRNGLAEQFRRAAIAASRSLREALRGRIHRAGRSSPPR